MGLWGRLMSSVNAGLREFRTYNQRSLSPSEQWDDYSDRLFRYHFNELYYYNTVFTEIETYRALHLSQVNKGLYKDTRAIYNPIGRLVDSYPSTIYGGQLDMELLTDGAIPLDDLDDQKLNAIRQLWMWSNWQEYKSLYVLYGAMCGDSIIKIVDEPHKGKVRMEVQHPSIYEDVEFDAVGNVKSCTICYEMMDKERNKEFTYREIITQDKFSFYYNDEPYFFYELESGEKLSEFDNEYGFVPVQWVKNKNVGRKYGMASGQLILSKVDELTALASRIHDYIGKVVNPMYVAKGVEPEQVNGSPAGLQAQNRKDQFPIFYISSEASIEPITTSLDLSGALMAMDKQLEEIERDTPELALHRLRQGGNLTAPGIRAGANDAVKKYQEAMGIYDAGLIQAHEMAMTIGGIRGYKGFEGFTIDSYDRGDLAHSIKSRPVIDDTLSLYETIGFMLQTNAPKNLIWSMLGLSDKEIEQYKAMVDNEETKALMLEMIKSSNTNPIDAMSVMNDMQNNQQQQEAIVNE